MTKSKSSNIKRADSRLSQLSQASLALIVHFSFNVLNAREVDAK